MYSAMRVPSFFLSTFLYEFVPSNFKWVSEHCVYQHVFVSDINNDKCCNIRILEKRLHFKYWILGTLEITNKYN